jgi:hypothetical protein
MIQLKAIASGVYISLVVGTIAQESNMSLIDDEQRIEYRLGPLPDDGFGERFKRQNRLQLERVFRNRLSAFSIWTHDRPFSIDSDIVSQSTILKSSRNALRDMAVETALVDNARDWLRNLIRGSVGSTDEEEVVTVHPDFNPNETAWLNSKRKNGIWGYGIRPFQTSPYAHVTYRYLNDYGEEMFLSHLRYHYSGFEAHRAEFLIDVPLMHEVRLTAGIVFSTREEDRLDGEMYKWSVRLERVIVKSEIGHIASFIGTELSERQVVLAGLTSSF